MTANGAGLPIAEDFYHDFGEAQCYGMNLTFAQLRKYLFTGAFSRGEFQEYRFVMQKFYALLVLILTKPKIDAEKTWDSFCENVNRWSPDNTPPN